MSSESNDAGGGPGVVRSWYLAQRPLHVLAAMVLAALAGGGMLHLATIWSSPLVGLGGMFLATLAAWVTTDIVAARVRADPVGWRRAVAASGLLGLALLFMGIGQSLPFVAFAGLVACTIAVSPIVGEVQEASPERASLLLNVGLIASLVGAVALAVLPAGIGILRLGFGAAVMFGWGSAAGGLAGVIASGAPLTTRAVRRFPGLGARPAVIGIVVGVAGVAASFVIGDPAISVRLALVPGWLVVTSMMVLSVKPARFGLSDTATKGVVGAGVALVALAGVQIFTTNIFGSSPTFVAFVVLLVALGGAWIVWRGSTLFLGVLAGFVLVWGLFGNTVSDSSRVSGTGTEAAAPEVAQAIVAFGDSFISGEGAERFYAGTDQKGDDRNECRRAPTAYPVLLAEELGDGIDFLACSGAKLAQVLDVGVGPTDASSATPAAGQYPNGPTGIYGNRLQLDHVADDRSAVELVLLSIGGNDVRFGDIVAGCLLPGSCAERREVWLDNVAKVGPSLTAAYGRLREEFNPDGSNAVPVVVMPYPFVLTERSCAGSPLDSSEHEFIYEFTTVLNQQIAASARQAGVHFFADGMFAFDDHRLCEDGDLAINVIKLQPTDGTLSQRMSPGSWTHNSMHPNEFGHELIANALSEWIDTEQVLTSGNPDAVEVTPNVLLGVRTPGPLAVSGTAFRELSDLAPTASCDVANVADFPTRVNVVDEEPTGFVVPIVGADPDAPICLADIAAQRWVELRPTEMDAGMSVEMDVAAPRVTNEAGRVLLGGAQPRACADEGEAGSALCPYAWVMFRNTEWHLRAVGYCSVLPACQNDFDEWRSDKIASAARTVAPSVAMTFVGGWLTALGWNLLQRKPLPAWLRRRLEQWATALRVHS